MITHLKKMISISTLFMFAFALLSATVNASQPPDNPEENIQKPVFRFTDELLMNFFDTNRELSELNKEMQDKIAEAANAHNLTLERFNQISNANRMGALQTGNFTEAEVEAFNTLGPQISQIQREQQQLVQEKLQQKGFTSQSYQEILSEYRTDQYLQGHVRELLRERRRQEILEERRREAEERAAQGQQN